MTNVIDVMALSKKVEHESRSGKLSRELLAQEQTLYGENSDYPDYLERITPDGKKSLGYWRNGVFERERPVIPPSQFNLAPSNS